MGAREFLLPDLGEGLDEADIVAWLVKEGDSVQLNQPLVEVETAKATVELPSPFIGIVTRLHATAGETVRVGTALVSFDVREAQSVTSTPAVRKLAQQLGVDIAAVRGTGPNGRVTRGDVERAADVGIRETGEESEAEFIPVTPVRRAIAEKLMRAAQIPQVTTFRTVDCFHLDAFRRDLGISPLPVVVMALVEVSKAHRLLNAAWAEEHVHVRRRVNVGVATDTDRGLVVPVVKDAQEIGIAAIAAEIHRLTAAARAGSLSPLDVAGATITVTNTGSYGSELGTPILNPPGAVIVALGLIHPRPLVVNGEVVARPACTLSLTFDHRVLDGADAGRALGDLVALLESRERLGGLPR